MIAFDGREHGLPFVFVFFLDFSILMLRGYGFFISRYFCAGLFLFLTYLAFLHFFDSILNRLRTLVLNRSFFAGFGLL